MATEPSSSSARIVKLDPDVVNRIAAGEVIHRPSSALKELMENSLDAGATSITVTVKNGGLSLLQIHDNGSGIAKDDFPLVCERFATSKLREFDDLMSVQTYGFRGEALASISHVAHVTITSMTADSQVAYRATFHDGHMDAAVKPCAGLKGTLITAEDMFYNVPTRKSALKNASEEYSRIVDFVSRYSAHHSSRGVAFTCKKAAEMSPDVHAQAGMTVLEALGHHFGQAVKKELVRVGASSDDVSAASLTADGLQFTASGYISNANFNMKKGVFILFINHRLVDCAPLKKAVDGVYADILPKHSHPFVYLELDLPTRHIDVNVHPTKREVNFLYQDELIERVRAAIAAVLQGANSSRVFYTQTILPVAPLVPAGPIEFSSRSTGTEASSVYDVSEEVARTTRSAMTHAARERGSDVDEEESVPPTVKLRTVSNGALRPNSGLAPRKTVRVDGANTKIDSYLVAALPQPSVPSDRVADVLADVADDIEVAAASSVTAEPPRLAKRSRDVASTQGATLLTSVKQLLAAIQSDIHEGVTQILHRHVFVGVVNQDLSLIQCNTKLLLVNHSQLARELFYQLCLRYFGISRSFDLAPAMDVAELARLAFDSRGTGRSEDRQEMAAEVAAILLEKGPMLREYFSIGISTSSRRIDASTEPSPAATVTSPSRSASRRVYLTCLPRLLDNHTPSLVRLPDLIVSLAYDVDWDREKQCFHTIAQTLAAFYAALPPIPAHADGADEASPLAFQEPAQQRVSRESAHWVVENILFPAFREGLTAPRKLALSHHVVQVASTEQLYRIFERC